MQSNIFCIDKDEFTVHWQVTAPDQVINPRTSEYVAASPTEQLNTLTSLTDGLLVYLKQQGYKPDPSKAARKGGGGGFQRQEQPEMPAPDAKVPQHCGQPMKYRKWEKDGKTFEKYGCRVGKGCTEPTQWGGFEIWRDRWLKDMPRDNGKAADENPFQEQVAFE